MNHAEFKPSFVLPGLVDVFVDGRHIGAIQKRDGKKRFEPTFGRSSRIPVAVMNQVAKDVMNQVAKEATKS